MTTTSESGQEIIVDWPSVVASEFASLPVEAPVAHLGPKGGWIPVNMDVVVAAEAEVQEFQTTLLGAAVTIRATPVLYEFSFGDGTVLSADFPGEPWPDKSIVSRYNFEGWYELSLTTTFTGEYSINGGPFIPIDGEINLESERHWVFADSLESRLVSSPVDPAKREIPPRTPATMGPPNSRAVVKMLEYPGQNTKVPNS